MGQFNGKELYTYILDKFQETGEKPSAYLQCFQEALNLAVKRGDVSSKGVGKPLLTQFCRGCWDNSLLSELQLKQKRTNLLSFPEFPECVIAITHRGGSACS